MTNINLIHKTQTYSISEKHIRTKRVIYSFDVYCTSSLITAVRKQISEYSNDESLIIHDNLTCPTGKLKYIYLLENGTSIEFVFYSETYKYGNIRTFLMSDIRCIRITLTAIRYKPIVLYFEPRCDMSIQGASSYVYLNKIVTKDEWMRINKLLSSKTADIKIDYFGK